MASPGSHQTVIRLTLYGVVLAAAALFLEWLDYTYLTRRLPAAWYIAVIAVSFAVLGIWAGGQLGKRPNSARKQQGELAKKLQSLSKREADCLALLCDGLPNKAIAKSLELSPNTVKTHLASVYRKLGVTTRVAAVNAVGAALSSEEADKQVSRTQ